jgi:membrane-bound acyltransferase YfiQ involved in biofilm formation
LAGALFVRCVSCWLAVLLLLMAMLMLSRTERLSRRRRGVFDCLTCLHLSISSHIVVLLRLHKRVVSR